MMQTLADFIDFIDLFELRGDGDKERRLTTSIRRYSAASFPRFWSRFQQETSDAWLLLSRPMGADQQPRGPGRGNQLQPRLF